MDGNFAQPKWQAEKECHSGPIAVWQHPTGGGVLYLGGFSRDGYRAENATIDLTGAKSPVKVQGRNGRGKQAFEATILAAEEEQAPYLSLPVEDYQPAPYRRETLVALTDDILALLASGQDVTIMCQGGHGRTGMVGTIVIWFLFAASGADPAAIMSPDPITWLRGIYCSHIVETPAQVNYVYRILGLDAVPLADRPKPYTKPIVTATYPIVQPSTTTGPIATVEIVCPACQKKWQCHLDVKLPENHICDVCYGAGWRWHGNEAVKTDFANKNKKS